MRRPTDRKERKVKTRAWGTSVDEFSAEVIGGKDEEAAVTDRGSADDEDAKKKAPAKTGIISYSNDALSTRDVLLFYFYFFSFFFCGFGVVFGAYYVSLRARGYNY